MLLEKTDTQPAKRERVARLVSTVIHPVVYPLLCLGIVIYYATYSLPLTGEWVLIAMLLTSVPVSMLVGFQVLRRRWTDLDVSVRRQRYFLYPFGVAGMLALAGVYAVYGAPEIAVRASIGVALANVADGLINFAYKVSAHATGAAVCAVVLWTVGLAYGIPAIVAALLVGWSRVALKRHTRGQVVLGWAVGIASTIIALRMPLPALVATRV